MSSVPLLASGEVDGGAMSCKCRKALEEIEKGWRDVPGSRLLATARAALWNTSPCGAAAIADFIDQHSVTCDCCDHVLLDVTAAREGSEQHCVAGSEGDGMGCAHSWRETVVTLEAEGDQLRADNERLRAALRATIDEVRTILQCGPRRDLLIQANAALANTQP